MIEYRQYGSGPQKVMVLHGWFGDSSAFDPMLPFLDQEQFTYVFMDYRGYGKSRHITGDYTMAEIAADALAIVDKLGWDCFHAVGHSMGGMAIQWLVNQAPNRLLSLTGITPVPACGYPMDPDTDALFRGATHHADNRFGILMHTTGSRLTPSFGKAMTQRSLEQTTPEAFDAYLTAWAQTNFADSLAANKAACQVPFHVVVGEHDPAITEAIMKETTLKWFSNAQLTVIPNAGHYPMIETPVHLATLMENFMSRHVAGKTAVVSA